MSEGNLHDIAANPPQHISGKHLKGLILAEAMESNPLLFLPSEVVDVTCADVKPERIARNVKNKIE
jgi:hypothetical protein